MKNLLRLLLSLFIFATWTASLCAQGYPQPIFNNDIRGWGCSMSLADNGPCINAAIVGNVNGTLYIHGGPYPVITPIVANSYITIIGDNGGQGIYVQTCLAGLRQAVANIDLLTMKAGGTVSNLCIDQATGVVNSSGHAIYSKVSSPFTTPARIEANQVNGACFGIGVTANSAVTNSQNLSPWVQTNLVVPAANNGCAGFVIGDASTQGQTGDVHFNNNQVYCGNNLSTGLLIKDVGGLYMNGNSLGYKCNYGTALLPGLNQYVEYVQVNGSLLGDSSSGHDIYIDTLDPSAFLFGNYFNGTWGASSTNGSVYVRNTANAPSVSGLYFRGFMTYSYNNSNSFDISGNYWYNIAIQDSTICSATASSGTGIVIGGAVGNVQITGNKIGTCDTPVPGALTNGINLATTNGDVGLVSDNIFGSVIFPVANPLIWNVTAAPNATVFALGQNKGLSTQPGAVIASAATISLPTNSNVFITGTTTITNMIGAYWANRKIDLTMQSAGSVQFGVGSGAGANCNTMTITQFQTVTATYSAGNSCWTLH